tara:strand:+ start:37 stop:489 length:453 start_codon:yes stop_codon:yes gene_type:complete
VNRFQKAIATAQATSLTPLVFAEVTAQQMPTAMVFAMIKTLASELKTRAVCAMDRVLFTHVVARTFQRVIAIAMEMSSMHWACAEAIACRIVMRMESAMMRMIALDRWTLAVCAMDPVRFTPVDARKCHKRIVIATETNWMCSVYAGAAV